MEKISLDEIRLFVAVVQAGSLSHTCTLTGIPISRLSRRLTHLEQALGTQLLNRGKKGVSLNELGKRFFEQAQTMLQQAQATINSVQNSLEKPNGLLRLSVAADIYHHVLAPILPDYLSAYPDVNVEIQLSHQKINMIQDGIDIAIRAGTLDNENAVAKSLLPLEFGVFASEGYLNQNGVPKTPNDLYRHKIIGQTLTLPWLFRHRQQTVEIAPQSRVASNDFFLVENLLLQGEGIGVLFVYPGKPPVGLVQVLKDWQLPASPLSLLYYKNRGAAPTVRSFVHWLTDRTEKQ